MVLPLHHRRRRAVDGSLPHDRCQPNVLVLGPALHMLRLRGQGPVTHMALSVRPGRFRLLQTRRLASRLWASPPLKRLCQLAP